MTTKWPIRRFRIDGRWWRWIYRPMRHDWGVCDYNTRTISIATGHKSAKELLDTEIHEALHALQVFANEDHTAAVATALADILHDLGYRRTEEAGERIYHGT